MKLKSPSRNVRYSFAMVVLLIGLVFGFAMLAGAITYKLITAQDNKTTVRSEKFDATSSATRVMQKASSQPTNSDNDVTTGQSTSQQAVPITPANTPASPVASSASTVQCSSLESNLIDTLRQTNSNEYATYTHAKDSLLGGLLSFITDAAKNKQIDNAYAKYQATVSTLFDNTVATLQSAGCNTRNVVLTLYPKY